MANSCCAALLLGCLCILSAPTVSHAQSRIVGGASVDPLRYPYYAYFEKKTVKTTSDGSSQIQTSFCGASLIHPDIVLTAAHCLEGDDYTVYVNITDYTDPSSAIFALVTDSKVHPDFIFSDQTISNDVALLKLDKSIFSIDFVDLNTDPSLPEEGQFLQAIGLGQLREFDSSVDNAPDYPTYLQVATVASVSMDVCIAQYAAGSTAVVNANMHLCTAFPGSSPCQGDSGGPLILARSGMPALQVGIVSFAAGCAREEFSNVYTRISTYADWIRSSICDLTSVQPDYCLNDLTIAPATSPIGPPPVTMAPVTSPSTISPFQAPIVAGSAPVTKSLGGTSSPSIPVSPIVPPTDGPVVASETASPVAPPPPVVPPVSTSTPDTPQPVTPMSPVTAAPVPTVTREPISTPAPSTKPVTSPTTLAPVDAPIRPSTIVTDAPFAAPLTIAPVAGPVSTSSPMVVSTPAPVTTPTNAPNPRPSNSPDASNPVTTSRPVTTSNPVATSNPVTTSRPVGSTPVSTPMPTTAGEIFPQVQTPSDATRIQLLWFTGIIGGLIAVFA